MSVTRVFPCFGFCVSGDDGVSASSRRKISPTAPLEIVVSFLGPRPALGGAAGHWEIGAALAIRLGAAESVSALRNRRYPPSVRAPNVALRALTRKRQKPGGQ